MTTLPAAADFTGSTITKGQFKTAITDLRSYLAGVLAEAGTIAAALSNLTAIGHTTVAKSATYQVLAADRGKIIDCTTGTWDLTFVACATLGTGFMIGVRNSGSGTITLNPNSTEQIDGATTIALAAGESCFVCTNAGATALETVGRAVNLSGGTTGLTTTGGTLAGTLAVANGGTGATTAATAADNLSVVKRDHGHGNIGSFCLATGAGTAGSTVAGSGLSPSCIHADSPGGYGGGAVSGVGSLSGTWRALGDTTNGSVTPYITLFQRIA